MDFEIDQKLLDLIFKGKYSDQYVEVLKLACEEPVNPAVFYRSYQKPSQSRLTVYHIFDRLSDSGFLVRVPAPDHIIPGFNAFGRAIRSKPQLWYRSSPAIIAEQMECIEGQLNYVKDTFLPGPMTCAVRVEFVYQNVHSYCSGKGVSMMLSHRALRQYVVQACGCRISRRKDQLVYVGLITKADDVAQARLLMSEEEFDKFFADFFVDLRTKPDAKDYRIPLNVVWLHYTRWHNLVGTRTRFRRKELLRYLAMSAGYKIDAEYLYGAKIKLGNDMESGDIRKFIKECIQPKDDWEKYKLPVRDVYQAYIDWFATNGVRAGNPLKRTVFRRVLGSRGYHVRNIKGRLMFTNISWKF